MQRFAGFKNAETGRRRSDALLRRTKIADVVKLKRMYRDWGLM
jgi:hypothetical protein